VLGHGTWGVVPSSAPHEEAVISPPTAGQGRAMGGGSGKASPTVLLDVVRSICQNVRAVIRPERYRVEKLRMFLSGGNNMINRRG